jgi:uncharacterized integral membrane protein
MKARTLFLVLLFALITAFVIVNWPAITAPTTLSLGVGTVQAPLGLLLLGCTVLVAAVLLFLLLVQQAGVIIETRRAAKELAAQRTLADEAEASRFTALRQHLDEALQRVESQAAARQQALVERIDRTERELHAQLDQTGNSLSAAIGELEDRLERLAGLPPLKP